MLYRLTLSFFDNNIQINQLNSNNKHYDIAVLYSLTLTFGQMIFLQQL